MKTLLTLSMLVLAVFTSIASCSLFEKAHYDVSALLTLTCFIAFALSITIVSSKKFVLR